MNTGIQTGHCTINHTGQETILNTKARFRVVACGRRFGKTETGKRAIIHKAMNAGRCWWLAPTYQMANQVWRDLKDSVRDLVESISETERRIDLYKGGMIAVRSTHYPDNLRGDGLDFVVLDEAAFMEPSVWPQVVRPMLLERNGEALFLSTPFGRNWFYDLYLRGQDPEDTQWASFQFSSVENPLVTQADLDEIRRSTPDRVFREEYLAEFIADAGQVFRGIQEAATAPTDAQPLPGRRYVMGVDWGKEFDYTCIVVMDADTAQMVAIDRFNQIGWALQRGRLKTLAEKWHPAAIWAEENSIGSVNIETLLGEGLPMRPFQTTSRSKAPLIEGLSLAIERGDLTLLPDEVLLYELAAYAIERLPGGGYRYNAPSGVHDDTVIATALAWQGVRYGGARLDFV